MCVCVCVCVWRGASWWPENYFKLKPLCIVFWLLRCYKIETVSPRELIHGLHPLKDNSLYFFFPFFTPALLSNKVHFPKNYWDGRSGVEKLWVDPFSDAVTLWDLSLVRNCEVVYQTHNNERAPYFCSPRPTRPSKHNFVSSRLANAFRAKATHKFSIYLSYFSIVLIRYFLSILSALWCC